MSRLALSNSRGKIIEAFYASNFAAAITEELPHAARHSEKRSRLAQIKKRIRLISLPH